MTNSILFFSFVWFLPFVCSVHFNISRFGSDNSQVVYQGDARANGAVELTNIDWTCRSGWVTYGKKIPLWDPAIGQPSDFTTRFSFRIDTRGVAFSNYGHGFAFFLAPAGIEMPPNSAGGFLGLFNETNVLSSSYPLVHVEFDTYANQDWDPPVSHVGINNNSLASANFTSWNASTHSRDIGRVLIVYDSGTRNLSVSWTYDTTSDPKENSSLSYIIDLSKVLPSEVTIGFSASSGGSTEGNRLMSWEYSSSLELRDDKKVQKDRKGLIIGVSASGFVLLTFLIVSFIVFLKRKQKKKRAEERTNLTSINEDLERGAGPRKFTYKDLATAANSFSSDRKLGRVEPETSLVEKVWDMYGKGEVIKVVDEKLGVDGFDEKQAECLMVVGLWCAHPDRNSRPSIKQAIQVLSFEAPLPHLTSKMPVASYNVTSSSDGTSVSYGGAGTATFSSVQLGR
ncbi:unnamed protein product [Eruca vesicaria subsp. sativa]|uniref:Legume lectin domain-containing protein n=1 Tax=Eruca vesicaria subsp. sativa TaxID=29727 RepID=A0ABC8K663_ERUVS|nr:unnamed protein product [Eruca vesicaria subsp. sativa]